MMIISKGRKSVSIVDQLFLSFSISSSDSSPQTLGGDRNDKVFFLYHHLWHYGAIMFLVNLQKAQKIGHYLNLQKNSAASLN